MVAAVAAAAAAFVLVIASPTLFVSAVGGAAIRSDIVDGCPYGVGFSVSDHSPLPGADTRAHGFEARRTFLEELRRRTPGTAAPVVTLGSGPVDLVTGRGGPGDGGVQLLSRTGAAREVDWVDGGPGDGLWLPDRTAEKIGAGAGDRLTVVIGAARVEAEVSGVFEDLAYAERSSFWCSVERVFEPFGSYVPPPVVLVSEAELTRLLAADGRDVVNARWELPPVPAGLPVPDAARAAERLQATADRLRASGAEPGPFSTGRGTGMSVGLPESVAHARAVGDAVRPLVQTIGVASFAIALLVVAAAGRAWTIRRHGEVRLLVAKGVAPAAVAGKAVLEMAPATIAGGLLGALLARVLVRTVGPSDLIGADAVTRSNGAAAASTVLALVLLGFVAHRGAVAVERARSGASASRPRPAARVPFELGLLGLAAAAFVELRSPVGRVQGLAGATYPADTLVVVFPLLLLSGGSLLAARALHLGRTALRRRGRRLPAAALLAVRRLAQSGPAALALVVGTALSIGILLYSLVIGSSARATVDAKAALGAGADLVIYPSALDPPLPDTIAHRGTHVVRSKATLAGGDRVAVLAVDPDTFAGAAVFDPSFADRPLQRLLRDLDAAGGETAEGPLPVLLAGELGKARDIDVRGVRRSLQVVAQVKAFPGQRPQEPLLVMTYEAFAASELSGTTQLWVTGEAESALATLEAAGYEVLHIVRSRDSLTTAALLPLATSLEYFSALGLLGGAVTFSGVVLYLLAGERQRRLAAVMTRRMGLGTSGQWLASALEVAALLVVGVGVAAVLAVPAALAVFPFLDPAPSTPPPALLRPELGTVALAFGLAAGVASVAAVASTIASRRHPPAEVMRLVP